jgi:hypothetical protein
MISNFRILPHLLKSIDAILLERRCLKEVTPAPPLEAHLLNLLSLSLRGFKLEAKQTVSNIWL